MKRKIVKIFLIVLLVIIAFPIVAYITVRTNYVQVYLTEKVISYLSEELNTTIQLEGIDISYGDIVIEDFVLFDREDSVILSSEEIILDFNEISLFDNRIGINNINFSRAELYINREKIDSATKELNIQFILDYIKNKNVSSQSKWNTNCSSLAFVNSKMLFRNDSNSIILSDFNLKINQLKFHNKKFNGIIQSVSCKEESGFELDDLSGGIGFDNGVLTAGNVVVKTPWSSVGLSLVYNVNPDTVLLKADSLNSKVFAVIDTSEIDMRDLVFFIPKLKGMSERFRIMGDIKYTDNKLLGENCSVLYRNGTELSGDFSVLGLRNLNEAYFDVKINRFCSKYNDLVSIRLPDKESNHSFLTIPKEVDALGRISSKGNVSGSVDDFKVDMRLYTSHGSGIVDFSVKQTVDTLNIERIEYHGDIVVNGLNLGPILFGENYAKLNHVPGKIFVQVNVKGAVNADGSGNIAAVKANVDSVVLNDYTYRNINMDGDLEEKKFSGMVYMKDNNIDVNFLGVIDLSDKIPLCNFTLIVDDAKLGQLNLLEQKYNGELSATMSVNIYGLDGDVIIGKLDVDTVSYSTKMNNYQLNNLEVHVNLDSSDNSEIDIKSDVLEGKLHGCFNYKQIRPSLYGFVKMILPSVNLLDESEARWLANEEIESVDLDFEVKINKWNVINDLFFPEYFFEPGTEFSGSFNSIKNSFELKGTSNHAVIGGLRSNELEVLVFAEDSGLVVNTTINRLFLSDSVYLDGCQLQSIIKRDTVSYNLGWDNNLSYKQKKGEVEGFLSFSELGVKKLCLSKCNLIINDSTWTMENQVKGANSLVWDSLSVFVNDFTFKTGLQSIRIGGESFHDSLREQYPNSENKIRFEFKDFDISNFDVLTQMRKFDLDGELNGVFELVDLYTQTNFRSNLSVKAFGFNNTSLGNAIVESSWNNLQKAVNIKAEIIYVGAIGSNIPVSLLGYYYPEKDSNSIDLQASIKNLKLKTIAKYLSVISSDFKGFAEGELDIKGTIKRPELSGDLKLQKMRMKIDYLNTVYTFADKVHIRKNYLSFDNLKFFDMYGNSGTLEGKVYHNNFREWNTDLMVKTDYLLCMNTTERDNRMYYGKAFVAGNAAFEGASENIMMTINAVSKKGSKLFIPVTDEEEVEESNFIVFVKKDSVLDPEYDDKIDLSGIRLNFDLELNTDAEVQMIFDSKVGDIIKGNGRGELKLEIDKAGDFNMYGDYKINEGNYLFTLQNVINKRFRVEEGIVSWNGDPYGANIDLKAIYRAKTSLKELAPSLSAFGIIIDSTKKVPVHCIINMKEKLFSPIVSFDIDFPGMGMSGKDQYKLAVESNLNKHIFSLLVLNRFYHDPRNEYSESSESQGAAAGKNTGSELLSNQLSNWLSQISNDFDIGINYRPGDEISSEEIEVALSTQMFNDKVIIDGNLGSRFGSAQSQNASNIVGDVNIEYKITEEGRFRVKAFNKSNAYDPLKELRSQYTQGLGVFYRKDFDRIGDLFRRKEK